jgi:hypothetical protein
MAASSSKRYDRMCTQQTAILEIWPTVCSIWGIRMWRLEVRVVKTISSDLVNKPTVRPQAK